MNNYFQIGDFELQYPIHLVLNGRKWNFKAEYEKKANKLYSDTKTEFDLALDLGFLSDIKFYRFIPFIVTDDVRVAKDKRTYYIADYFFPEFNLVMMNHEFKVSSSSRYLKQTLRNLGYEVMELPDFTALSYEGRLKWLKGFKTSMSFRTKLDTVLPKYFE